MSGTPDLLFDARDIVGESIVYDAERDALLWVDIGGRRLHRLALSTRAHEVWTPPEMPTSIGLRADGGAIVGFLKRVALWDYGAAFATLAAIEPDRPGNRLNEGVVAPDGSFWVGTMQNNITADGGAMPIAMDCGALYRVSADGTVSQLTPNTIGIANTLAWTDDGRLLTADTRANALFAYDPLEGGTGLANRRPFGAALDRGYPDGSTLDAEGFLWNCRVAGGACLARFDPDGTLDRLVELPCTWPTSCAFGGRDLATLFVTSARFTMSPAHLDAHPGEGGVYAIDVGVRGRPCNRFGRS